MSIPSCPDCGNPTVQLVGALPDGQSFAGNVLNSPIPGGNLYRCDSCYLAFRYPQQDLRLYEKLYNDGEPSLWSSEEERIDWKTIADSLSMFCPAGSTLLDYGCHTGGLLSLLDPSHSKYGIEINARASSLVRSHLGYTVWDSLAEVPQNLKFQAILAVDVIEHVPNPSQLLASLVGLLDENGVLVISTGDADTLLWRIFGANWWYCGMPEHISFISERWLKYHSRRQGMDIRKVTRFRYEKKALPRLLIDACAMLFYGLAPKSYRFFGSGLQRLLSRPNLPIRGPGVVADHILAFMTKGPTKDATS
jgi:SAM-dependent methyltransferase